MKRLIVPAAFALVMFAWLGAGQAAGPAPAAPSTGIYLEPALDPSAPTVNVSQAFTYQGRLTSGGTPYDGLCDFQYGLWDALTGGLQKGITTTVANLAVNGGLFTASVNGAQFGSSPFDGNARWLDIAVRCPAGSGSYTPLTPRQALTAVPYAQGLRFPFAADVAISSTVFSIDNTQGGVISARTYTSANNVRAIDARSISGTGNGVGVYAYTNGDSGTAVYGYAPSGSGTTVGVHGVVSSPDGVGVRAEAGGGRALYATSNSSSINRPTVHIVNTNGSGIALFASQNSNDAALVVTNEGTGDLIKAFGSAGGSNLRFRVTQTGTVYADGSYLSPAADFAEMLPAAPGLEPGHVLIIGLDGQLTASTQPYQANVAGVYSTRPGYLGNSRFADEPGYVPLAIVGVVPVKVSAENGPVAPGDLLVASATPGHAMRAAPVEIDGYTFYPSGVIIGKALEEWIEGTGVILMLVSLQ